VLYLGMGRPHEELEISIEAWSIDGAVRHEVLARVCNVSLALAAFNAAREARPHSRIMIRHGTRRIRDSHGD
jgi:hypothetical protein